MAQIDTSAVKAATDTLAEIEITESDNGQTSADTLKTAGWEIPLADSLQPEVAISEADTLAASEEINSAYSLPDSLAAEEKPEFTATTINSESDSLSLAIAQRLQTLDKENANYSQRLEKLEEIIERFDSEIIPYCLFAIGSIYHNLSPELPENGEIMAKMQEQYPENKFTTALNALQNNLPMRLIDPREEKMEQRLDNYLGNITTAPDSALAGLEELSNSPYHKIKLAANFRLGWYYSFEKMDTLLAKPYLKAVLDEPEAGEYATVARRFFDGNNFLLRGAAPVVIPQNDSTAVDSTGVELQESIKEWNFPTPAEIYATLPDSLKIYSIIPMLMDSLAKTVSPLEDITEEPISAPEMETPADNPIPAPPQEIIPEKKEEPPLE
ncbi:MAG: hypothetical protein BWX76_00100 [Candidatus Cloacimonetes bacterium ADurb.Bin089]|nr:MAG: hypothetical protein BWX76_00100 [Candidatus Cloacimonetes bacterium ADurb.Bin089]